MGAAIAALVERNSVGAKLSTVELAVEALVRRYTCGSVIDAAWDASHRIWDQRQKA